MAAASGLSRSGVMLTGKVAAGSADGSVWAAEVALSLAGAAETGCAGPDQSSRSCSRLEACRMEVGIFYARRWNLLLLCLSPCHLCRNARGTALPRPRQAAAFYFTDGWEPFSAAEMAGEGTSADDP